MAGAAGTAQHAAQQVTQHLLYGFLRVIHTMLPCPAQHAAACKAAHANAIDEGDPAVARCYKLLPRLGVALGAVATENSVGGAANSGEDSGAAGEGAGGWRTGYKRGARDGEEAARRRAGDAHTRGARQAGHQAPFTLLAAVRGWRAGASLGHGCRLTTIYPPCPRLCR